MLWQALEHFVECKVHLVINVQEGLLRSRPQLYGKAVHDAGAPLEGCVGFIDCTKIKMARLSGDGLFGRECYFGHKRMHCLVVHSITTPDGLILGPRG